MIYGLSNDALAFKIGTDAFDVMMMIDDYYGTFPQVKQWMNQVKLEAQLYGKITLWTGRVWESIPYADYQAINASIQGSSAELTNMSAIRLNKFLKRTKAGSILSIIHDEFLFSLSDTSVIPELVNIMEAKQLFGVPFLTDVEITETY